LKKKIINKKKKKKIFKLLNYLTLGLGISIPATTTRLVGTNDDILNGRNTGSPVSG
jgi:hypothetical protein